MDGINLMRAAKIIHYAGKQLESLIESLTDKIGMELGEDYEEIDFKRRREDVRHSDGNWIIEEFQLDIPLKNKPKRTLTKVGHIGVKVVLYDDKFDSCINGWEPSIYIQYANDDEEFDLESFKLSTIASEEGCSISLSNNRLWICKDDGEYMWFGFVLPIVKLNNEDDLLKEIVYPLKKLIKDVNDKSAFHRDSKAFCYNYNGEGELCLFQVS